MLQTWYVSTKVGPQHYLVYIVMLKWLESKKRVMCLKLRAELRFLGILCGISNFSQEVVQAWFVCHETWNTTLFGIYYCVYIFRIQNNSHMLEIT